MTNINNTVLYIGVTSNLQKRIFEHKQELVEGFTKKYRIKKLIYYENYNDVITAIEREKKLKRWRRKWKEELVKKTNPRLIDLYYKII